MVLAKYKHSSGTCKLYMEYDKDFNEFILCAVDWDVNGTNVAQIDLDAYSYKKMKKLMKKMKKYLRRRGGKIQSMGQD